MKIQALIVEDVRKSRELLKDMIVRYCPEVEVVGMAESVDTAVRMIHAHQPHLIFLDIEMPNGTGFDLLEKFPDLPFEVIFTTAYDQYALRAIKFCALDYLLKPIQIEELIEAVRKAREQISSQKLSNGFQYLLENLRQPNTRKHKLALPTMEGFEFVSIDRIVRCQGDEGYTILIINDGSRIITTRRLRELEELLVDHDFFRIHRSHLINLSFLQKYHKGSGGYVIMSDGTNVDVSRRKKDEFIRRLDEL